jgi:hypothetical protein
LVSAKNTFIETANKSKFVLRRSFSDSQLCVDADGDDAPIYAIREEEDMCDYPAPPDFMPPAYLQSVEEVVSKNPSLGSLARLNSSELIVESFITGKMMKFATCERKIPGPLRQATLTTIGTTVSYSSLGSTDFYETDFDLKTIPTLSSNTVSSTSVQDSDSSHSTSRSPHTSEARSPESLQSRRSCDPKSKISQGSESNSNVNIHDDDTARMAYMDRAAIRQMYADRPVLAPSDEEPEYIDMNILAEENRVPDNMRTTVMMRNIPCRYDQSELLEEVMELNLPVNFLYLPGARKSVGNLGYAFLNFTHPQDADLFIKKWNGHVWRFQPRSRKIGKACYATLQGFTANIQYYSKMKISRSRNRPYVNYDLA